VLCTWHNDGVEIPAAEQPGEADVGDVGPREHDALQPRTVNAEDGGDVVVALLREGQDSKVVHELKYVRKQVSRDGRAVGLLEVELLDAGALVQATDGRHEHAVDVSLRPEPPRVLREEEYDVLHEVLARRVEVAGDLERAEDVVEETLVKVRGNKLQERRHQLFRKDFGSCCSYFIIS
jgi:hypothetical protein